MDPWQGACARLADGRNFAIKRRMLERLQAVYAACNRSSIAGWARTVKITPPSS